MARMTNSLAAGEDGGFAHRWDLEVPVAEYAEWSPDRMDALQRALTLVAEVLDVRIEAA